MRDFLVRLDTYERRTPQTPRPRYFIVMAETAHTAHDIGNRICERRYPPGDDWVGAVIQSVSPHIERWKE